MASRKLRPSNRSAGFLNVIAALLQSRFSSLTTSCLFVLLFTAAIYFASSKSRTIDLQIKTILGDNLQPTPWHPFAHTPDNSWRRLARIFLCSHLNCLRLTNTHPSPPKMYTNGSTTSCPYYFQWIHEDLAPWRRSKISPATLEAAKQHAAFRVVIVGGRLYTEFYYACVQKRAMFTLWGFVQLLKKYPGMIPDVDLMFDCMDRPKLMKRRYRNQWPPPPLFRYCGNKDAFDIPFPDWSFWGWPETSLLPWNKEFDDIIKVSQQIEWEKRHPFAYWKGNPFVSSPLRENLLKCNSTEKYNWGAQVFHQDWNAEASKGYKNSKVADQCKHRYKIYAEGHAWSVSFKYILSCDSPVLVPTLTYYDFFTRGLIPQTHYWPIRHNRLCPSIKFAVDWGNKHSSEAQAIGKAGQNFMRRNVTMDYVYDYMLHLLNEYAKLQSFQPTVPQDAEELCQSGILCFADAKNKALLKRSSVQASRTYPCSMPSPDHNFIVDLREKQWNKTKEVWLWEEMSRKTRKINRSKN